MGQQVQDVAERDADEDLQVRRAKRAKRAVCAWQVWPKRGELCVRGKIAEWQCIPPSPPPSSFNTRFARRAGHRVLVRAVQARVLVVRGVGDVQEVAADGGIGADNRAATASCPWAC